MKSLRWMWVLGLALTQSACPGEGLGPPAAEFEAAGVYRLRVVGPEPLPYAIPGTDTKGTPYSWITGETLRIQADGRYRLTHTEAGPSGVSYDSTGTYTIVDDTTVELSGGRRLVVSGVTATIASCARGRFEKMLPCVYVREGADAGPSLTYTVHGLTTFNGGPLDVGSGAVTAGRVWVWGDGRYRREIWRSGMPSPWTDEGTYQLSGSTITLRPKFTLAFPDLQPVVGTYSGGTLTLGGYGYSTVTLS